MYQILAFLFLLQIKANFSDKSIDVDKKCNADGCIPLGFVGPVMKIYYGPSGSTTQFTMDVPAELPWQVTFVDGTCYNNTFQVIVEDSSGSYNVSTTVSSTNPSPGNMMTQLSAQLNPACANVIRNYIGLGPPGINPPYYPSTIKYSPLFRVRIVVKSGNSSGYGFLQIVPYYASDYIFNYFITSSATSTIFVMLPWQVYVPIDGSLNIPALCAIRGGVPVTSDGKYNYLINLLTQAISVNPRTNRGRYLMDDGTGSTCWSVSVPSGSLKFVSNPLECAQIAAGSIPVICSKPSNPGHYTFPTYKLASGG